jgi:hypothetical protein
MKKTWKNVSCQHVSGWTWKHLDLDRLCPKKPLQKLMASVNYGRNLCAFAIFCHSVHLHPYQLGAPDEIVVVLCVCFEGEITPMLPLV